MRSFPKGKVYFISASDIPLPVNKVFLRLGLLSNENLWTGAESNR